MSRIVIIGNSGGGKSTLARRLSAEKGLRHVEVDSLLWQDGWTLRPAEDYDRLHDEAIAGEAWIMDGLGTQASIPRRLARATEIVLIDMPLWVHFWLAAERQIAWAGGTLDHMPGGSRTGTAYGSAVPNDLGGRPKLDAGNQDALRSGRTTWSRSLPDRRYGGTEELRRKSRRAGMTRAPWNHVISHRSGCSRVTSRESPGSFLVAVTSDQA